MSRRMVLSWRTTPSFFLLRDVYLQACLVAAAPLASVSSGPRMRRECAAMRRLRFVHLFDAAGPPLQAGLCFLFPGRFVGRWSPTAPHGKFPAGCPWTRSSCPGSSPGGHFSGGFRFSGLLRPAGVPRRSDSRPVTPQQPVSPHRMSDPMSRACRLYRCFCFVLMSLPGSWVPCLPPRGSLRLCCCNPGPCFDPYPLRAHCSAFRPLYGQSFRILRWSGSCVTAPLQRRGNPSHRASSGRLRPPHAVERLACPNQTVFREASCAEVSMKVIVLSARAVPAQDGGAEKSEKPVISREKGRRRERGLWQSVVQRISDAAGRDNFSGRVKDFQFPAGFPTICSRTMLSVTTSVK